MKVFSRLQITAEEEQLLKKINMKFMKVLLVGGM